MMLVAEPARIWMALPGARLMTSPRIVLSELCAPLRVSGLATAAAFSSMIGVPP